MSRLWRSITRGWSRRGHERSALVQVAKGTIAAPGSYLLAVHAVDSQVPSFAPFAALLVTQVTIYRSLLHAIRYFIAVIAGLVCVGGIGLLLGENFWTLTILVFVTLTIGQWPRLHGYGPQVAIVGVFAFAAGGGDEPNYLVSLLATVTCGAIVGAAVNVMLAGPIRFSDVGAAITGLASSIQDLLTDMAEQLRSDNPFTDSAADSWRERSAAIVTMARHAGEEIDLGEENIRLNPHRLGKGSSLFVDYRHAVDALRKMSGETEGIVRAVGYADRGAEEGPDLAQFLADYSDLLETAANAVRAFADQYTEIDIRIDQLSSSVEAGLEYHQNIVDQLHEAPPQDPKALTDAGVMLVEAERLLRQVDAAQPTQRDAQQDG